MRRRTETLRPAQALGQSLQQQERLAPHGTAAPRKRATDRRNPTHITLAEYEDLVRRFPSQLRLKHLRRGWPRRWHPLVVEVLEQIEKQPVQIYWFRIGAEAGGLRMYYDNEPTEDLKRFASMPDPVAALCQALREIDNVVAAAERRCGESRSC